MQTCCDLVAFELDTFAVTCPTQDNSAGIQSKPSDKLLFVQICKSEQISQMTTHVGKLLLRKMLVI